jgi:hypothetical protein
LIGSGLLWNNTLVHFSCFPGEEARPSQRQTLGEPPRVKGATGKEIDNLELIASGSCRWLSTALAAATLLTQGRLASGSSHADTKKEAIHEDAALLAVALVCFHHCLPASMALAAEKMMLSAPVTLCVHWFSRSAPPQ